MTADEVAAAAAVAFKAACPQYRFLDERTKEIAEAWFAAGYAAGLEAATP